MWGGARGKTCGEGHEVRHVGRGTRMGMAYCCTGLFTCMVNASQCATEVYASSGSKVVHKCMKQSVVRPPIVMDLQPSQKKLARHFRERLESVGMVLAAVLCV